MTVERARTAGAVLAGGQSRRMGRDKAAVEVDGTPMAERVAAALVAAGCDPVVAVGGSPIAGYDTVSDLHPGDGPLGGVITALRHLGTDTVVAACDLPDLDAATVGSIATAPRSPEFAVRVAVTDVLQPHLGRWSIGALPVLEALFAAGERSLRGALTHLAVEQVAVAPDALLDVDTPDDLAARMTRQPGGAPPGR